MKSAPPLSILGKPKDHSMNVSRQDAENKDLKKPCGIHFSKPGHSLEDIQAFAFEEVFRKDQPIFRKERESFWINQYQAIEHGANIRC